VSPLVNVSQLAGGGTQVPWMAVKSEFIFVSPVGLSPMPPAPLVHMRHASTHVHHVFLFAAASVSGATSFMAAFCSPVAGSLHSS